MSEEEIYTPPPPTVPPPPHSPAAYPGYPGYPTYPSYPSYPGYPGYPPGYPPQFGYAYPPPAIGRPGTALGAAVLGFVVAGLLLLAGVVLLTGASTLTADSSTDLGSATGELALDAALNCAAAAFLIAGGVALTDRRASGRTMLLVGISIVVCEGIYWLSRWSDAPSLYVFWAGVFVVPAIIAGCLAGGSSVRAWLDGPPATPR